MKKVILILILLFVLSGCTININNYNDSKKDNISQGEVTDNSSNLNEEVIKDNSYNNNYNNVSNNNSENIVNSGETYDNVSNNDELVDTSNIKSEDDVVNYFVKLKEKVIEVSKSDTWQNVKGKVIEALDIAYGFCFKGEEIGGYTLSELSTSAKEKVLNIVFDIDAYLEEVSPGYKDSFKDSYHNLIDSTKESLGLIKDKLSDIFSKNDE